MTINFRYPNSTILLLTLFLSGCASIVSKSSYPISINSTPSGAQVTIKNKYDLTIYEGNTPAYVSLKSGDGFFAKAHYSVTINMDGYQPRVVPVHFGIDGWYFGNILFGGFLGLLIIDPATGAMWKLETSIIHETLVQKSARAESPALEVFDYNNIPDSWKPNLIRIN